MARCDTLYRSVIKGFDPLNKQIYLYQPRCKMWSCLPCANTNRLLWQAKISNGYQVYMSTGIQEWRFVTLTSHPKLKTAEQCQYVFKSAWSKLSARMRRKYKGVRYVLLPEHNKDNRVHWHMICSHGMERRWLKDSSAKCGLGYIADCDEINDHYSAIFYVAKYLGKGIGNETWPANLRRIRTSQKWPVLPPEDESYETIDVDWHYWLKYPTEGIDYLAYELERETGYQVNVISKSDRQIDNYADKG